MKTVYKYPIPLDDGPVVMGIPAGSQLLDVAVEEDRKFFLWALVDTTVTDKEFVQLQIVGTGHELTLEDAQFFRTIHLTQHGLVFHVFVRRSR